MFAPCGHAQMLAAPRWLPGATDPVRTSRTAEFITLEFPLTVALVSVTAADAQFERGTQEEQNAWPARQHRPLHRRTRHCATAAA
jgi:hypothetical protein